MERGPPSRSSPSHRNRRLHLVALLSPGLLCRMAVQCCPQPLVSIGTLCQYSSTNGLRQLCVCRQVCVRMCAFKPTQSHTHCTCRELRKYMQMVDLFFFLLSSRLPDIILIAQVFHVVVQTTLYVRVYNMHVNFNSLIATDSYIYTAIKELK